MLDCHTCGAQPQGTELDHAPGCAAAAELDRRMEMDEEYLSAHPQVEAFFRPALRLELNDFLGLIPGAPHKVRVSRLVPGVRNRQLVIGKGEDKRVINGRVGGLHG